MVSRPTTECVSHSEALEQARHLAMQWLHPSDTPVDVIDGRSSKPSFPLFSGQRVACCA